MRVGTGAALPAAAETVAVSRLTGTAIGARLVTGRAGGSTALEN